VPAVDLGDLLRPTGRLLSKGGHSTTSISGRARNRPAMKRSSSRVSTTESATGVNPASAKLSATEHRFTIRSRS